MATDNFMYKEERIITYLCKYTARKKFLVKAYNLQINLLSFIMTSKMISFMCTKR